MDVQSHEISIAVTPKRLQKRTAEIDSYVKVHGLTGTIDRIKNRLEGMASSAAFMASLCRWPFI
jgi:hypothetical protein